MIRKLEARTAMSDEFDPYRKWLGIPSEDQPVNFYRLLGIPQFEDDPDVIQNAADRQMAHVRTFQAGQHSKISQRVLNELSAAKLCLLHPESKSKYDEQLRAPPVQVPPTETTLAPPVVAASTANAESFGRPVANTTNAVPKASPLAPPIDSRPAESDAPRMSVRARTTSRAARMRRRNATLTVVAVILLLIGLLVAAAIAFKFAAEKWRIESRARGEFNSCVVVFADSPASFSIHGDSESFGKPPRLADRR